MSHTSASAAGPPDARVTTPASGTSSGSVFSAERAGEAAPTAKTSASERSNERGMTVLLLQKHVGHPSTTLFAGIGRWQAREPNQQVVFYSSQRRCRLVIGNSIPSHRHGQVGHKGLLTRYGALHIGRGRHRSSQSEPFRPTPGQPT